MTKNELTKDELIILDAVRSFSGSDRAADMFIDILSGRLKHHIKVDALKNGTGKKGL